MRPQGVEGKIAEAVLDEVGLCTNKNAIPDDKASPMNPNGIRLGSPVITTRGMKEEEAKLIGVLVGRVIKNHNDQVVLDEVAKEVKALTKRFPLYA